jgi:hypothetical protein
VQLIKCAAGLRPRAMPSRMRCHARPKLAARGLFAKIAKKIANRGEPKGSVSQPRLIYFRSKSGAQKIDAGLSRGVRSAS